MPSRSDTAIDRKEIFHGTISINWADIEKSRNSKFYLKLHKILKLCCGLLFTDGEINSLTKCSKVNAHTVEALIKDRLL